MSEFAINPQSNCVPMASTLEQIAYGKLFIIIPDTAAAGRLRPITEYGVARQGR